MRHLSFHAQRFEKYSWPRYEEATDKALCFICKKAFDEGKVLSNQVNKAFIETAYSNWKNAGRGFSNYQASEFHKAAHSALFPGTADVGERLSDVHSEQKKENRQFLIKIISNLRYLARQAEPFRGSGDDNNSNFIQLLKLKREEYSMANEEIV